MEAHKAILFLHKEKHQSSNPTEYITEASCDIGLHAHRGWSRGRCASRRGCACTIGLLILIGTLLIANWRVLLGASGLPCLGIVATLLFVLPVVARLPCLRVVATLLSTIRIGRLGRLIRVRATLLTILAVRVLFLARIRIPTHDDFSSFLLSIRPLRQKKFLSPVV